MAKDNKTVQQGLAFFSVPQEAAQAQDMPAGDGSNGKTAGRGPVWRANLFLDADMREYFTVRALRENKSISVYITEILRGYMNDHPEN